MTSTQLLSSPKYSSDSVTAKKIAISLGAVSQSQSTKKIAFVKLGYFPLAQPHSYCLQHQEVVYRHLLKALATAVGNPPSIIEHVRAYAVAALHDTQPYPPRKSSVGYRGTMAWERAENGIGKPYKSSARDGAD